MSCGGVQFTYNESIEFFHPGGGGGGEVNIRNYDLTFAIKSPFIAVYHGFIHKQNDSANYNVKQRLL